MLGCLATAGIVPDLPAPMQGQLRADGGIEPCVPHPGGWIATEDADDVAALVERIVIRNVLQPLVEELRGEQPLARGLLWGNVASAARWTAPAGLFDLESPYELSRYLPGRPRTRGASTPTQLHR